MAFQTDKQRNQDGFHQPCNINHQVSGHDEEIAVHELLNKHDGKRKECHTDRQGNEGFLLLVFFFADNAAGHFGFKFLCIVGRNLPHQPRYPLHHHITEQRGDEHIEEHEHTDTQHDRTAPLRIVAFAAQRKVLVIEIALNHLQIERQTGENCDIVRTGILVDAVLQIGISLSGIVVQPLHLPRNVLIVFVVFRQRIDQAHQIVTQGLGIGQTLLTVLLFSLCQLIRLFLVVNRHVVAHLVGKTFQRRVGQAVVQGRRQGRQRNNQAVVAGHFGKQPLLHLLIRHIGAVEFLVEVGGLLAGIGHIERKVGAL